MEVFTREEITTNKEIVKNWDKYKRQVIKNPILRPVTVESWQRCKELGVEPYKLEFTFLTDEELKKRQGDNYELIEAAAPYMEHLSSSLLGIPHIIALSDSDGWIIELLGEQENLGGREAGLDIGSNWSEKYIGNNGVGTALTTGEPVLVYGIEHYGMSYKGCACIGVPIRKNNKIIGALDISVPTEHAHPERLNIAVACVKSIESTIEKKPSKKSELNFSDRFTPIMKVMATAVHDLKNPLSVIRGLGQVGDLVSKDSKERGYYKKIIKQADILNDMLRDLLDTFKPQEPINCDLRKLINEVVQDIMPLCDIQDIEVHYNNTETLDVVLNESMFKRAIKNLLENAINAMTNGGKLSISYQIEEDKFILSISDTGIGIPSEIRDSIFEPFMYKRQEGTGLGLFMVHYTITEIHNGTIWFESEVNKGTTFYMSIPTNEQTL